MFEMVREQEEEGCSEVEQCWLDIEEMGGNSLFAEPSERRAPLADEYEFDL